MKRYSIDVLNAYLRLIKPRIMFLLNYVALASFMIAAQGVPNPYTFFALLIAGSLATGGSMAVNDYLDRERDMRISWLKNRRPIPAGMINPAWRAVAFGLALLIIGLFVAIITLPPLSATFIALGAFFYTVVYTIWLKPRHWSNIIGGAAGSFAALAGWAAVRTPDVYAYALAILIFLWTPSHFWSLALTFRGQYASADIPMLTDTLSKPMAGRAIVASTLLTVAFSIQPFINHFSLLYLMVSVTMGAILLLSHLPLLWDTSNKRAWFAFKVSSPYLAILLMAMVLDSFLLRQS